MKLEVSAGGINYISPDSGTPNRYGVESQTKVLQNVSNFLLFTLKSGSVFRGTVAGES